MGAEELCQALAVEIGMAHCNDDNIPSMRTVLSCCQGLVVVDREGLTVRLIHHTLQEYLASDRNLFQSPHSTIAETCLTYLNSEHVMTLPGFLIKPQRPPFLEYSSLYWGAHLKKEISDSGKTLALKLFSHYQCHISIKLLLEHHLPPFSYPGPMDFYKFTGLHCASIFGLVDVMRALIIMDGVDINGVDEIGATPLLFAAMSGSVVAVKFLLGREDVDPDKATNSGRTPISWAARNGNEAVVKLLLGCQGVTPDKPDSNCRTPILWAAMNGNEAVVKLLLGRQDVNPDKPDNNGQTPISWAAMNGNRAVVKLLLGREDVSPDKPRQVRLKSDIAGCEPYCGSGLRRVSPGSSLIRSGLVRGAGLTIEQARAGLGSDVPSPGCPANLVNGLPHISDFHDTLSPDHHGIQNLSQGSE